MIFEKMFSIYTGGILMEQMKENKMGVMPVNKLLLSMSLPMMISMLVQSLYNIVDSIFVAQISENALTAVSLAFPMQTLMIAASGGIGVGINAILSRSLGQKNYDMANKTAINGIFLEVVACIIFIILGFTVTPIFYRLQVGEGEIMELGIQYLSLVLTLSFGIFMQMTFERLLQATGKTMLTMITQTTGAIINIIFDPILIFGLFGMPGMGVAGAAIATVMGQIVASVMAIIFNFKYNNEIHISFKRFRPDSVAIKQILGTGIPSMIMQAIGSVMTFCMNKILNGFSSTAVAVFGVYFKLNSFVFMPVFGLNNGMVPIVAYNFGAKKRERLLKTIKYSAIYAVSLMIIGLITFQFIPEKLLLLFNASEQMLKIGVPALRIISLSFGFAGVCIVLSSVFQALGQGFISMLMSFLRQLIVLLPSAYILSLFGKVDLVWWSYNIAEIAALAFCVVMFIRVYKKVIKPL